MHLFYKEKSMSIFLTNQNFFKPYFSYLFMLRESSPDLSDTARNNESEQEEREKDLPPQEKYAKEEHLKHKKEFSAEVKYPYN